jgi:hypothetical protein
MSTPDRVCGETYDHDLWLVDVRDGVRIEECSECSALIITNIRGADGHHAIDELDGGNRG